MVLSQGFGGGVEWGCEGKCGECGVWNVMEGYVLW